MARRMALMWRMTIEWPLEKIKSSGGQIELNSVLALTKAFRLVLLLLTIFEVLFSLWDTKLFIGHTADLLNDSPSFINQKDILEIIVMGAKHSKLRIRRNRRPSSIRKRQAPEGSNDPVPTPNETSNCGNNKATAFGTKPVDDSCKFCGVSEKCHNLSREASITKACDDVTTNGIYSSDTRSFGNSFDQAALKVNIPRSPVRCRNCVTAEKSRNLPAKAGMHDPLKSTDEDDEQELTITLYEIDKMSGRVPREDMVRLMSSIYEAVDAKVGESPQGRKTLRVRLSVTPERKSQTKVHRTPSTPPRERSRCRCANCPNTEPSTRKTLSDHRLRRHESDVSPDRIPGRQNSGTRKTETSALRRPSRDHSGDNNDRTRHYAKLEGLDNTMYLHKRDRDNFIGPGNKERSRSLPQNRQRAWPKFDESQKPTGTKHRQRYNAGDHRTAKLRTRRKEPRFASPYDQHFQEAMYLRLRELQRQGAFEMRRATGRQQDSDEADDDSESDVEFEKTLCGADDRDAKSSDENAPSNNKSRVVSPTPNEFSDLVVSSVHHHHHHYHHGLSGASVLSSLNSQDALVVKCITNAANILGSSVVPKTDGELAEHHHYHHHAEDS